MIFASRVFLIHCRSNETEKIVKACYSIGERCNGLPRHLFHRDISPRFGYVVLKYVIFKVWYRRHVCVSHRFLGGSLHL